MTKILDCFKQIEEIVSPKHTTRGLDQVNLNNQLYLITEALMKSKSICIVSGFQVAGTDKGETDGPIGALSLANALNQLGKNTWIVTDYFSKNMMEAAKKPIHLSTEVIEQNNQDLESWIHPFLKENNIDHLIAIERPGLSQDGHYYSMNGVSLHPDVCRFDQLFNVASQQGIITSAIGDGGNEIGMGKIKEYISKHVPQGVKIVAQTETDFLLVTGVSNWGGHAISGGLSLMSKKMLLYDEMIEKQILAIMVAAGAIDGCTKAAELSVDGLPVQEHMTVVKKIRTLIEAYIFAS